MSVSDSLRVQVAAAIHETLCGLLCDDEKPEDHDYDAADRVLSLLALTEEWGIAGTLYDGELDLRNRDGLLDGGGVCPEETREKAAGWAKVTRAHLVHRFVGPWVPDDVQSGS